MSEATASEGVLVQIGTADAADVDDAGDTFVELGEVVSFSDLDGGSNAEIDVTHMRSTAREYLVGLPDAGTFSMEVNTIFGDAGQDEFRTARSERTSRNFRVTLPDTGGTVVKFKGFPMTSPISAGVDQKLASTFTVRITGDVEYA